MSDIDSDKTTDIETYSIHSVKHLKLGKKQFCQNLLSKTIYIVPILLLTCAEIEDRRRETYNA